MDNKVHNVLEIHNGSTNRVRCTEPRAKGVILLDLTLPLFHSIPKRVCLPYAKSPKQNRKWNFPQWLLGSITGESQLTPKEASFLPWFLLRD